ncbi:hydrogenase maturation nickel metallochaperone HypA [Candidatus Woesearchaeota archaeon]|nr:hydrogenase maturation nickel metallochaperone HypA [Candidatus Woesearchaeota archaeon]
MHEQAIAKDIIDEASRHGAVEAITVEVGDLAHLPADELKEALRSLVPGWRVVIREKRGRVACECGYEGEPEILEKGHDSTVFRCPECQAVMPRIVGGDEIVLVEVEVA